MTRRIFETGGDVLVPAAPAFATILDDPEYHAALREANYVILDSGLVAFLCLLKYRRWVSRISGLRLIDYLFSGGGRVAIERAHILWIVPQADEAKRIESWISGIALPRSRHSYYIAPMYGRSAGFSDQELSARIAEIHPDAIIVCIGGGTQEKLAWHLKRMVYPCPPILCTGAAVSFLTGTQARIPRWVDRACLGWLWRIFDEPKKFGGRYGRTVGTLPRMLWQYYRTHASWD